MDLQSAWNDKKTYYFFGKNDSSLRKNIGKCFVFNDIDFRAVLVDFQEKENGYKAQYLEPANCSFDLKYVGKEKIGVIFDVVMPEEDPYYLVFDEQHQTCVVSAHWFIREQE